MLLKIEVYIMVVISDLEYSRILVIHPKLSGNRERY